MIRKNAMRIFALVAAAVMSGSIGTASANSSTGITFDKFCDGMQLQTADGKNFTSKETGACLQGVTVTGSGALDNGIGIAGQPDVILIVNWAPFEGHSQGAERMYIIQYPFVPNGTWEEFRYQPGKHCPRGCGAPMNQGQYTLQ
jgi:hypothetical protein